MVHVSAMFGVLAEGRVNKRRDAGGGVKYDQLLVR